MLISNEDTPPLQLLRASLDGQSGNLVLDLECFGKHLARWWVNAREIRLPLKARDVFSIPGRPFPGSGLVVGWLQWALSGLLSEFNLDRVLTVASPRLSLPEAVLRSVRRALSFDEGQDRILWLQIDQPAGYLHFLPWEQLLRSPLEVRLLRLPYRQLKPQVASGTPEVVLCCSSPSRRDALKPAVLTALIRQIADALPPAAHIHLFMDEVYRQGLKVAATDPVVAALGGRVICHCPPPWLADSIAKGDRKAEHPWISWIQDELSGKAVDVLHFIAAADWSADGAYLSIAAFPLWLGGFKDKSAPVRYISDQDVDGLLNRLGAWSCVLSSPRGGVSLLGLREFVDRLARRRPGSIVLHDVEADPGCLAVGGSYRFLHGGVSELPPESDGVSITCNPWQIEGATASPGERAIPGVVVAAIKALREIARAPGDTPSWVAASQRYLEQEISAPRTAGPESALERGVQRGAEEALRLLSEVLMEGSRGLASRPPNGEEGRCEP